MISGLSYVNVWVHDQDEALAFYTEKLGFELREDVTVAELGNFRWLTVGVPGQEVALTLMPGARAARLRRGDAGPLQKLVAKGAAGGLFFWVDDIRKTYEDFKSRGVEFTQEPVEQPYGARRRLPRHLREPLPDDAARLGRARPGRAAPRSRPPGRRLASVEVRHEPRAHVVEVLEGHVRRALVVEVAGQAGAGEHEVGGARRAAVRPAVADVRRASRPSARRSTSSRLHRSPQRAAAVSVAGTSRSRPRA